MMIGAQSKIVLAGGAGFLGNRLSAWFAARGCDVVVLTRRRSNLVDGARCVYWDGRTFASWREEIDGADALINLAGRSVNCRYTAHNRQAILDSRILSTRLLHDAVCRAAKPPRAWFNASTATIYEHSLNRDQDEKTGTIGATPEAKDAFSIDVALAWEEAFFAGELPETRRVALRTAMVFGIEQGTVYRVLRRLVRCGLGGAMAGGGQYVSWIHESDFCRAVEWLLQRDDLAGAVNLAAPHPLTNDAMMRLLRRRLGRPFGLPATTLMLEAGAMLLRTETELIIKSRRVTPGRLLAAGFPFSYSTLESAVVALEQRLAIAGQSGRNYARVGS